MIGENLPKTIGPDLDGSYGQIAGSQGEGIDTLVSMAGDDFDATSPYTPEAYDAAALFLMAMQKAGSSDPADYKDHILDVANAPGTQIFPGELGKALELIKNGEDVDYVGASAVELVGPGEAAGTYRMIEVKDGKNETIGFK